MPQKMKDIRGLRVGSLTVVSPVGNLGRGYLWLARCDCGKEVRRMSSELQKSVGKKASCGCMGTGRPTEHGMPRHPAYGVWRGMLGRCSLPSHQAWRNYGARGIFVCERWKESFQNFWADMGGAYQPGLTLERKDNNAGYSAENCRWATPGEQQRNTRLTRVIRTPRGDMPLWKAVELSGLNQHTLWDRNATARPAEKMFDPPKKPSMTS